MPMHETLIDYLDQWAQEHPDRIWLKETIGDTSRAPIAGPSEVRAVAAAFNMMSDKVQSEQRAQQDRFSFGATTEQAPQ